MTAARRPLPAHLTRLALNSPSASRGGCGSDWLSEARLRSSSSWTMASGDAGPEVRLAAGGAPDGCAAPPAGALLA